MTFNTDTSKRFAVDMRFHDKPQGTRFLGGFDTLTEAQSLILGLEHDIAYYYVVYDRIENKDVWQSPALPHNPNTVTYTYDALKRLIRIEDEHGLTEYAYDSSGNRTKAQWVSKDVGYDQTAVREWANEWVNASSVSLHECAKELIKALDTVARLTAELNTTRADLEACRAINATLQFGKDKQP